MTGVFWGGADESSFSTSQNVTLPACEPNSLSSDHSVCPGKPLIRILLPSNEAASTAAVNSKPFPMSKPLNKVTAKFASSLFIYRTTAVAVSGAGSTAGVRLTIVGGGGACLLVAPLSEADSTSPSG